MSRKQKSASWCLSCDNKGNKRERTLARIQTVRIHAQLKSAPISFYVPINNTPKEVDIPIVKVSIGECGWSLAVGASEGLKEGLEEGVSRCCTTGAKKLSTLADSIASLKAGVCSSVALYNSWYCARIMSAFKTYCIQKIDNAKQHSPLQQECQLRRP